MGLWRIGRGWPEQVLREYLAALRDRQVSFSEPFDSLSAAGGWTVDGASAAIGREPPGPPAEHGHFGRARLALIQYDFSDPRIVTGHFDPRAPLLGRDMLLEIKVFGVLRFLGGVRVRQVVEISNDAESVFGFRYDTLEGHIERGGEWFRVRKNHATGVLDASIQARWRRGDFPNWWTHLGFLVLGNIFRRVWRRRAVLRLRRLAAQPAPPVSVPPGGLLHQGRAEPTRTRVEPQNQ
jgi:uncharacterized protein (UPF0548 family)